MITIFQLLLLFQLKHFVCDFPLQGRYMLGKFKREGWVLPLAAHCVVHAAGSISVLWLWSGSMSPACALKVGAFDFAAHFVMDRVKASPALLGRWTPESRWFWWALGLDQAWHHLTHYAIIAWLVGVLHGA